MANTVIDTDDGGTANTVLTYGVDSYFQVTIPESVEFKAGETVKTATITVDKDSLIPIANYLTVSLTASENYMTSSVPAGTTTRFRLAASGKSSTKEYEVYIPYTIKRIISDTRKDEVSLGNSALRRITMIPHTQFASATEDITYPLEFTLVGEPTAAGNYTDTLTFTVSLVPFS